jgi:hypothetical protein
MAARAGELAMAAGQFERALEGYSLATDQYQAMGDSVGLEALTRRVKRTG